MQPWSRTKKEVTVFYDYDKPFINHSFINTEWMLLNISVTTLEANDYVWLEFMLHLKRNHDFYGIFLFKFFFLYIIIAYSIKNI